MRGPGQQRRERGSPVGRRAGSRGTRPHRGARDLDRVRRRLQQVTRVLRARVPGAVAALPPHRGEAGLLRRDRRGATRDRLSRVRHVAWREGAGHRDGRPARRRGRRVHRAGHGIRRRRRAAQRRAEGADDGPRRVRQPQLRDARLRASRTDLRHRRLRPVAVRLSRLPVELVPGLPATASRAPTSRRPSTISRCTRRSPGWCARRTAR